MTTKKKAVALKYNLEQDLAPVVIASGYGEIAERIINIAEERGIPVYRDDSVASMLCMLEVGATIPEELYQVVATIYVQILETANRIKGGDGDAGAAGATIAGMRVTAEIDGAQLPVQNPFGGRVVRPIDHGASDPAIVGGEAKAREESPEDQDWRLTATQIADQIRKQLTED